MPANKITSTSALLALDQPGLKRAIFVVLAVSMKHRQKILRLLSVHGPMLVMELRKPTKLNSVVISQHLRWLKEAGLVISEREGISHRYLIHPEGYEKLKLFIKPDKAK